MAITFTCPFKDEHKKVTSENIETIGWTDRAALQSDTTIYLVDSNVAEEFQRKIEEVAE